MALKELELTLEIERERRKTAIEKRKTAEALLECMNIRERVSKATGILLDSEEVGREEDSQKEAEDLLIKTLHNEIKDQVQVANEAKVLNDVERVKNQPWV